MLVEEHTHTHTQGSSEQVVDEKDEDAPYPIRVTPADRGGKNYRVLD